MEKLNISINTGIKLIDVTNERGEVTCTLKINTGDSKTVERFANVIDNLNKISDELSEEAKKINEIEDEREKNIQSINAHVSAIQKTVDEIDYIFGAGCIRNIYHECYELNESFLPDETMLMDFLESVMPIMNELFNERFEAKRQKYNVNRKGKR